MDITKPSFAQISAKVVTQELSPIELAEQALSCIEPHEPQINAFATVL